MTSSAANVEWRQLPGEETSLEIRMPIILSPTTPNSEISVTVSDSAVLIVKVSGATIWQVRMYAPVEDEVEWVLENNKSVLVMEVTKKSGETWPALLNIAMKADDQYFLTKDTLDDRIARELPSLPPVNTPTAVAAPAEEKKEEAEKKEEDATPAAEEEKKEDGEAADAAEATPAAPAATEDKKEEAEEKEEAKEDAAEEKKEEAAATAEAAEEKEEEAEKKEEAAPVAEEKKEDGEAADAAETAPAVAEDKKEEAEEKKEEAKEKDPLDMLDDEDLLNDALDEVVGTKPAASPATEDGEEKEKKTAAADEEKAVVAKVEEKKEKTAEEKEEEAEAEMVAAQIKAELRGIEMETNAIMEKLEEMMADLAKAEEGSEAKETLSQHVKIASRMLELVRETRTLRSEKATVELFLKVQKCDIQKARVNIGETGDAETEEFQDDYEKTLTGLQLFKGALQYLNQDPATAVHLLRLAAIHHHHAPSVVALFSIYTNVPSSYPRGASLILQNALRGETSEDIEARTNSRVGDLFDSGTRHFPPIFSMAVHFHQRAALAGNTHSMVSLAQLFLAGECSGDDTMAPSLKRLNKDEKRANYFLQCAIDRGSIVAYLIRAAQYAAGTDGMPKSLDSAKKYYERAMTAEASLNSAESKRMRIGSRMTLGDLEKLLVENNAAPKMSTIAASNSSTTTKVTEVKKGATAGKKVDDDDDIIELRPTSSSALTQRTSAAAVGSSQPSGARVGGFGVGAPSSSSASARAGAGNGALSAPAKKNTGFAASANKRKAQWERVARWGITAYAAYVLAFPLRLIVLPFFYETASRVMEMFGISAGNAAGSIDSFGL